MQFSQNISRRRKITMLLLLISMLVQLAGFAGLYWHDLQALRQRSQANLETVGQLAVTPSLQMIARSNKPAAKAWLESVVQRSGLTFASLHTPQEGNFASAGVQSADLAMTGPDGLQTAGKSLILREPVSFQGNRLGTLLLGSDLRAAQLHLLLVYLMVFLVAAVVSSALAFVLSQKLDVIISNPITHLVEIARGVREKKDYSLRADATVDPEIGQFTEAFNEMLEQIEQQDAALQKAPEELSKQVEALQHEISERKRVEESLRAAELKYRSLVEQLPVITYNSESGNTGVWFYVSPQIEGILGYTQEEWVGDPDLWKQQIHPEDLENIVTKAAHLHKSGDQFIDEYRMYDRFGRLHWFRDQSVTVRDPGREESYSLGFLLDVTEQKQAEIELDTLQQQLLDISRQAGMAEVATGVLHNVGNVLNSVNVSSNLLSDLIRNSKLASFGKVTALLNEHSDHLAEYITSHAKGKLLPTYLISLSEHMTEEHVDMLNELEILTKNIEHIKDIVSMQQSYAKVSGMVESIAPGGMMDDALQINSPLFNRNGIKVVREDSEDLPLVSVEKHKVLQILVNLLRNAKNAMEEVPRKERKVFVGIHLNGNNMVKIKIKDQGMGIAPENLTRIFSHGFTTKSEGHGFGLHIGALAAQEMGGSLMAESQGPGEGATFTLELPIATRRTHE